MGRNRDGLVQTLRSRLAMIGGLLSLFQPIDGHAQTQWLRPPAHGAREVRGFFIPPPGEPARGYVAGHALLLRDPGGLMYELSQLCASARTAPDSVRPAIRRRVAALEVRRARAHLRRIEFGTVPPGRYLALAWIEFQWPPTVRGDSTAARSKALSCLEFLVVPEPAERVVTPIARSRTPAARPA